MQIERKVLGVFNRNYVEAAVLSKRDRFWQLLIIVRAAHSPKVDAGLAEVKTDWGSKRSEVGIVSPHLITLLRRIHC